MKFLMDKERDKVVNAIKIKDDIIEKMRKDIEKSKNESVSITGAVGNKVCDINCLVNEKNELKEENLKLKLSGIECG